ncbi:hypothetical protein [Streptomyces sp. NBC_00280]|uniref:hypothetical protein n=1 Tax=Streptomyces sp. NBC_00280 TaxID=2975699 RepID=UPI002F90E005
MRAERRGVSGFGGQRLEQARFSKGLGRSALATASSASAEAVLAAHAQAMAARPAHTPLLLEGRLLERPAAHFDMTPDELRALAFRLSNAPERGLL